MRGFPRHDSEMQRLREENENLRASLNSCKTAFELLILDDNMKLSSNRICAASIREIKNNLR